MINCVQLFEFLSTPSARRATNLGSPLLGGVDISIHALREEGDRHTSLTGNGHEPISIHALREEGDTTTNGMGVSKTQFLSTPSARRAT